MLAGVSQVREMIVRVSACWGGAGLILAHGACFAPVAFGAEPALGVEDPGCRASIDAGSSDKLHAAWEVPGVSRSSP